MAGTLYVVATPLGNLEDLSPRAAATLTRAAAVAAEDTRHTKPLLAHVGSRAELISFHAHSSDVALRRILHLLATGKDVALVTDAGTPTVSATSRWSRCRDPPPSRPRCPCRDWAPIVTCSWASSRARAPSGGACSSSSRRASGPWCCSRHRRAWRSCSRTSRRRVAGSDARRWRAS